MPASGRTWEQGTRIGVFSHERHFEHRHEFGVDRPIIFYLAHPLAQRLKATQHSALVAAGSAIEGGLPMAVLLFCPISDRKRPTRES